MSYTPDANQDKDRLLPATTRRNLGRLQSRRQNTNLFGSEREHRRFAYSRS